MSYKRIGSLIHNWSHSFVSMMNYVDDDYVIDELGKILRRDEVASVVIDPLNRTIEPPAARTSRIVKSVGYYADALAKQMEGENVLPHELASFRLVISRPKGSMAFMAEATDDRGKDYSARVVPS